MNRIILVIGVPGSGKTWVCEKLQALKPKRFEYVPHDFFIQSGGYLDAVLDAAASAGDFPVLMEAPFGASETRSKLLQMGVDVFPVFILEEASILQERYQERDGKSLPPGHLTRQNTYAQRAEQWEAFSGTSEEVFEYLRGVVL